MLLQERYGLWDIVSLTEQTRTCSKDFPGYVIRSWMWSRNTLELRQWENDMNEEFDDNTFFDLNHLAHMTSLAVTPSFWIRRTHDVGASGIQDKGGGTCTYPGSQQTFTYGMIQRKDQH